MKHKDIIEKIDAYVKKAYEDCPRELLDSKVFYNVNECSGIRFYLKAIYYKNWPSLKYYIKNHSLISKFLK